VDKIAVIYWSGSGNTEKMAKAIVKGVNQAGKDVDVFQASDFSAKDINAYEKIAFGCPSMGCEVLEETEFEPFFQEIESALKEKQVALFGSYGWGDGEWMRNWQERVIQDGAKLFEEGVIINDKPDLAGEEKCTAFGERFANQ
jgi:flavodoxin short chain